MTGEPVVEPGSVRGIEETNHRGNDPAFLDEVDKSIERALGVVIKAEDKAALNFNAGSLDFFDALNKVAIFVLGFAAFVKVFLTGRFDADEDTVEAGLRHKVHEFLIVGHIDGCLRVEIKWIFFCAAPFDDGRKYVSFEDGFLADEIVINKEYVATPARVIDVIEFGDNLLGGLGAILAAKERGNVTELAIPWAAARVLYACQGVGFHINDVISRYGRTVHVRTGGLRSVDVFG